MFLLKACPKCHGDLYKDQQDHGELGCMACGWHGYALPPLPLVTPGTERPHDPSHGGKRL